MTDSCKISIMIVRNDRVQVEIKPRFGDLRKFDIVANKDGLKISSDKHLAVLPVAANAVTIDTAEEIDTSGNKITNTEGTASKGDTLAI